MMKDFQRDVFYCHRSELTGTASEVITPNTNDWISPDRCFQMSGKSDGELSSRSTRVLDGIFLLNLQVSKLFVRDWD